jgi:capsular exopolysaccharide synthesis family protein
MQENNSAHSHVPEPKAGSNDNSFITPNDVRRFVNGHSGTILSSLIIGLVASFLYVMVAVPLYTARTLLVIDPTLPQVLNEAKSDAQLSIDNAQIESQLEVIRSEKIAAAVMDQLKLTQVNEFATERSLRHPFSAPKAATPEAAERTALGRYQSNLTVRRIGISYAIEILYSARDPKLAAAIANATAEAYIQDQLKAREQAARSSNDWLEERIDRLRVQMNGAALNVQEFRAKRDYRIGAAVQVPRTDEENAAKKNDVGALPHGNTIEELDSTAQTYRRLYESYLLAYAESVQKQSYPVTNARIITSASPLIGKSHPKTNLILPLGAMVGAIVGICIAYVRHSIDNSVTSAQQIRDEIGVECLASISRFAGAGARSSFAPRLRSSRGAEFIRKTLDQRPALLAFLTKAVTVVNARAGLVLQGRLARKSLPQARARDTSAAEAELDALRAAVAMPFSGFGHGIKSWKTAISLASRNRKIRTLAITSALPGEGKTTLAANLAALYAAAGTRVLLLDGDLRTARLSKKLAPDATLGLVDLMEGTAALDRCIVTLNKGGPDLLPATGKTIALSEELLGSDTFQQLMQSLLKRYDIIIIELPPLAASVDSLAMSSFLDATVVVAEWGKTPVLVLSEAVYLLRNAGAKILGVVLNKVDTATIRYGDVVANYHSPPASAPLKRRAQVVSA